MINARVDVMSISLSATISCTTNRPGFCAHHHSVIGVEPVAAS